MVMPMRKMKLQQHRQQHKSVCLLLTTAVLLLLGSCSMPSASATAHGSISTTRSTRNGRPSSSRMLSVNPLLGVFDHGSHSFADIKTSRKHQQRRRVESFHDVLLCTDSIVTCDDTHNHNNDDLHQVRSLGLSSRVEQRFFRRTSHALLQKKSWNQQSVSSDHHSDAPYDHTKTVVECSSTAMSTTLLPTTTASSAAAAVTASKAAGKVAAKTMLLRPLVFWENMVCGAISRSMAQTVMHPANTMKTILQSSKTPPSFQELLQPSHFQRLWVGAGANFLLSLPHGAVNFAVLEYVRAKMNVFVQAMPWEFMNVEKIGPAMDFCSSCISTICCSVVSTPQMMITDNIMAGNYPTLPAAVKGLYDSQGIKGFYSGWLPGLAGKIPAYALTWTLFQQLKDAHRRAFHRAPKDLENSIMGCLASATTVTIMIPVDTVKTRLVTQASSRSAAAAAGMAMTSIPYKGIVDCAVRVYKEEGLMTFYRGLPPRLVSVVPMIGIQFGVYEFMKKVMIERKTNKDKAAAASTTIGKTEKMA